MMIVMTMKTRLARILTWLGGTALTLLGFPSCTTKTIDEEFVGDIPSREIGAIAMYGVPTSAFRVSGTVRSEEGKSLKGIQVVIQYGESTWMRSDTTYTDSSGKFSREMRTYPANYVRFIFNDVDGAANGGKFQSQTVTVDTKKVGDGDGGWFAGTYEATATVSLSKK